MFAITYLRDEPTLTRYEGRAPKHEHVFAVDPVDFRPCDIEDLQAISAWCVAQFGQPSADTWAFIPYFMFFTFRDADDAFVFRMRWC